MLEAKVTGNEVERLDASGNVVDLTMDVCMLIGAVHDSMRDNPVLADAFRYAVTNTVGNPKSPLWDMTSSSSEGYVAFIPVKRKDGDRGCE